MSEIDDRIKQKVREWVSYADGDLEFAYHGLKLETGQTYRIVAYHAQQSVEKYLKAYLVYRKIDFPYTHNITQILALCGEIAEWTKEIEDAKSLTPYASTLRYPGVDIKATREEAIRAVKIADHVREVVKSALIAEGIELK
jgi:HEPN domain-containing protein